MLKMKRFVAWTILMLAPKKAADRLCESEMFARWLDPKGWFGAA